MSDQVTRLLLVRHGQVEGNIKQVLIGQSESKLTKLGLKQADDLGKYLRYEDLEAVYSSTLSRAQVTANQIVKYQAKKLVVNPRPELKEINCGRCLGLPKTRLDILFPNLSVDWARPTDPPFPGGECLKDVQRRSLPVIKSILAENQGKTILVVGHGILNRVIIGYYLQIPFGMRIGLKQDNCCINEIDFFSADKFKIKHINFTIN